MAQSRTILSKHTVIGWREVVDLPDLRVRDLEVKADTGAKTSALHAKNIHLIQRDGRDFVQFSVDCASANSTRRHVMPVHAVRNVKNSGGTISVRYSVRTRMAFGPSSELIELTLADRATMRYDMILGRRALRRCNMIVDPSASNLLPKPAR